jgi:hypothetical protein
VEGVRKKEAYLQVAKNGGQCHEQDEEKEDPGPEPTIGDAGQRGLNQGDRHHPHSLPFTKIYS